MLKTIRTLNRELDVPYTQLRTWCQKNNVEKFNSIYHLNEREVDNFKKHFQKRLDLLEQNHHNENQVVVNEFPTSPDLYLVRTVAEKLGIVSSTVSQWCSKNGVTKYLKSATCRNSYVYYLNKEEYQAILMDVMLGKVAPNTKTKVKLENKKPEISKPKQLQSKLQFDLPQPINKLSIIKQTIKQLKLKTELAQLDLKREELALEIDKVMR